VSSKNSFFLSHFKKHSYQQIFIEPANVQTQFRKGQKDQKEPYARRLSSVWNG